MRTRALLDHHIPLSREVWAHAGRRYGFRVQDYRLERLGLCRDCTSSCP